MSCFRRSPAFVFVLAGLATTCFRTSHLLAAPSEAPPPDVKPTGMDTVFERIAVHAAKDRWTQDGWRDAVLEAWLDNVIAQVRTATGDDKLDLPVRFGPQLTPRPAPGAAAPGGAAADVKVELDPAGDKAPATAPAAPPPAAPVPRGPVVMQQNAAGNVVVIRGADRVSDKALVVARNVKMSHAMNSIILADGNAEVSFARHCVIIARGAVYVAHGENNVIVAGSFIHVSHDGSATVARNPNGQGFAIGPNGQPLREVNRPGSLLMSGGTLDVSHASGTTCFAKNTVAISHATTCTFINPPPDVKISNRNDCRDIVVEGLRVDPPPRGATPRVQVDWMTPGRGAVVRFNNRRLIADVGKPILDEAGKEVAGLEGWMVTFCDQGYVLFTKDREDFVMPAPVAAE